MTVVVDDGIARVTLQRPEARNALNRTAYSELETVFRSLQADVSVRVV
ncbi:MAG: enoyl-CoA hydratase/isomerase family protein, partial [Pseudomonadales bacterium]